MPGITIESATSMIRILLTFVALSIAGLAGWRALSYARAPITAAQIGVPSGGDFELEDGSGRTVSTTDFRGRFLLLYFGYTSCPDVCPTALGSVAAALPDLGAMAERLAVGFVTLDPQRDTPAVVRQYAALFDPSFIGLSGTEAAIHDIADQYGVQYRRVPDGQGYLIDHSSALYLLGPTGRLVATLRADLPGPVLAKRLNAYLKTP